MPTAEELRATIARNRSGGKPPVTREGLLSTIATSREQKPSLISRATRGFASAVDRVFTPPEFVNRAREQSERALARYPWLAAPVPFAQHKIARDAAWSIMTPGDLALLAGTGGTSAVAKKALIPVARAASAALGLRGAQRIAEGETTGEKIAGGVEGLFGFLGARAPRLRPPAPTQKALPAPRPRGTQPTPSAGGPLITPDTGARPARTPSHAKPSVIEVDPLSGDVKVTQYAGVADDALEPTIRLKEPSGQKLLPQGRPPRFAVSPSGEVTDITADVLKETIKKNRARGAAAVASTPPTVTPADDGYTAFAKAFDDIAAQPGADEPAMLGMMAGWPNRPKGVSPLFASRLVGGTVGVNVGARGEDDTTAERALKVGVYGTVGFFLPSLVRGRQKGPTAGRVPRPGPSTAPGDVRYATKGKGPLAGGQAGSQPNDDILLGQFKNPIVRTGVAERLEAHAGDMAQRRGVVTNEAAAAMAERIKVDAAKALPKGSTVTSEGAVALARAVNKTQGRVAELSKVVSAGGTDADLVAFAAAKADADVVLTSLMGARAEAGRSLQVFRHLSDLMETGDVELTRSAADALRSPMRKLATAFNQLPDDPIARYRFLQDQSKRKFFSWDTVRNYYYANILSGVKTHERNVIGNTANLAFHLSTHPFGVGLDAARSVVSGKPRELFLGEMKPSAWGALQGLEEGFHSALFTLRHGMSPDALKKANVAGELGKFDFVHTEFAGGGANPFNWPSRGLAAGDQLFRTASRRAELSASAYAMGRKEGLKGNRLADRMAELMTGATPEGAALREQAERVSTRAVFQERGAITDWIRKGHQVPGLKQVMTFTMPFVKTPGNILRQGLEVSPAGFALKGVREGGRFGAQMRGRAAAGTVTAVYLAWLASTGRISGSGPEDRAKRDKLYEEGWRPNSVKLGDKWVSYQLFQPVSVQAAVIANAFEAWQEGTQDEKSAANIAANTMSRSLNSFLDQSFLVGMFDFASAVQDPGRYGPRIWARTATGLIPGAGALRTAQAATDPVQRQAVGVSENVMAALPGLSRKVQPRIGRSGQVTMRDGGAASRAVDPFNTSTAKPPDLVSKELEAVGVRVTAPTGRLTLPEGMEMTRAGGTAVKQVQGQTAWRALEMVIQSPGYQKLDTERRRIVLERVLSSLRPRINEQLRRELPSSEFVQTEP